MTAREHKQQSFNKTNHISLPPFENKSIFEHPLSNSKCDVEVIILLLIHTTL